MTINHLGDLKPDKNNARRHNPRNISMVETSLQADGFGRSILLDAEGNILAGNGVTEAAGNVGLEDVLIVPSDGTRVIAIQRTDVQPGSERAVRLAIADNRTSELSDFDPAVVAALAEEVDLSDFWRDDELDALLAGIETDAVQTGDDPGGDLDHAEQLQEKWRVNPGDLFSIGDHRLLCGDSTNADDVARLMGGQKATMAFTDPPWNVAIGKDSNPRHRQRAGLENDDLSAADFADFLRGFATHMIDVVSGDVYCILGASEWPTLDAQLRGLGFHWSATIIWVKDQFVLGRSKYHRRYEPIWYGWHEKAKSSYGTDRTQDDVWEVPRPKVSEDHPTMKPPELIAHAIENSSRAGDIVYEPFCGSGSTVVAAAQLQRRCFAMELAPKYCSVILERLSVMGVEARLLEPQLVA